MKNEELKEVMKQLNWKERIIAKIFTKTIIKMYNKGVEKGFNSAL